MWDSVIDLIVLEALDRLPRPLRIGCYTLMVLFALALVILLLVR